MTDADRASYARQFEAAKSRLPRGHVINGATWRNGQLSVTSAKPERMSKDPVFEPRVRRGVQTGLFD